jgi:hypothetical protein
MSCCPSASPMLLGMQTIKDMKSNNILRRAVYRALAIFCRPLDKKN